jgi:hypothetical protein
MPVLSDTTERARLVHEDVLRRKSPLQRLRMAQELTIGLQKIAFAAMRQRNPELTDDEIWMRLAERRLGADVVRSVYRRES